MVLFAKLYDAYFGKAKGGGRPPIPCAVEDDEMAKAGKIKHHENSQKPFRILDPGFRDPCRIFGIFLELFGR